MKIIIQYKTQQILPQQFWLNVKASMLAKIKTADSSDKRHAVDIPSHAAKAAFELLPVTSMKRKKNNKGEYEKNVDYTKRGMKLAPNWTQGVPYIPCARKLFESSGGVGINHVQLLAQFIDYAKENHLDVTDDDADTGIYRIRTLMNQLCNHVTKSRRCSDTKIPLHMRRHYQVLYDSLNTNADHNDDGIEEPDQIVCLGTPPRPSVPLIDVEALEISDDDGNGETSVLVSANPKIAALLDDDSSGDESPRRTRIMCKTTRPSIADDSRLSASEITTLVAAGSGDVGKQGWMQLNAKLKEQEKEKRKGRGPKAAAGGGGGGGGGRKPPPMKAMKAMKSMKAIKACGLPTQVSYPAYEKRIHSMAYHSVRNAQLLAGKSADQAKRARQRAGREATHKL